MVIIDLDTLLNNRYVAVEPEEVVDFNRKSISVISVEALVILQAHRILSGSFQNYRGMLELQLALALTFCPGLDPAG